MTEENAITDSMVSVKEEVHDQAPETGDDNQELPAEPVQTESDEQKQTNKQPMDIPEPPTESIPTEDTHQSLEEHFIKKSSHRQTKFPHLRASLETRSLALNHAWTELNALLSEYKAELLVAENHPSKFDNVTDLGELKNELIEKENENIQLRQQFESLQQANEQTKMDLSIKDSLLKKYQDDLLQKETALIHANTKVAKLESRLRVIESTTALPRKVPRTMSPGRLSLPKRLDSTGILRASGLLGKSLPKRSKPGPLSKKQPPVSPSAQPSTSSTSPIVCIEVDDDEVISDVQQAAESVNDDTMYMDPQYSTDPQYETFQEDQNNSQQGVEFDSSFDQSGQFDQSLEPTVQGALEQGWDVPLPQVRRPVQGANKEASSSPSTFMGGQNPYLDLRPKLSCHICRKLFSNKHSLRIHVNVIHYKIMKYKCPACSQRFGQAVQRQRHLPKCPGMLEQQSQFHESL